MDGNTFNVVDFLSATFQKDAYFNGSVFNGNAIFGYAEFYAVDFQNCTFRKEAHFHFSKFNVEGKFDSVRFESFLLFNTSYSNRLYFTNTTFNQLEFRLGWVNHVGQFWNSIFLKNVQFDDTVMKIADFRQCQFYEFLSFLRCGFEKSDFSYSKFHDGAHYIETKFLDSQFNYVTFNKPREIIFQNLNLSNLSFANTDISAIHFGDNVKFGKDGYTLYEENLFTQDLEFSNKVSQPNTLDSILALYRNLRENFEFQLRYDEAGKFFVKEMELKRKYKEQNNRIIRKNWREKNLSPTGIYFHLGEYGENEIKPLKLLAVFIGISLLYWIASYPYSEDAILFQIKTEETLSELVTPLINFTISNPSANIDVVEYQKDVGNTWMLVANIVSFSFEKTMSNLFQVNDKSNWFDYIMRVIYIILLGVFFIAIRRKLERRFRH
jgi:uncharacterized protein YjbI with pentapeptide repeats